MGFIAPIAASFSAFFAGAATAAETATVVTTAATAVGAATAAYSALGSAAQAKYQSHVAKANAEIAQQNREAALVEGNAAASIERTNTGRRVAGAIAEQAASGLDVNFGSPFEIQGVLRNEGDLDALTIQYNSQRRALGFANQASGYAADATTYKSAAKNDLVGGALNVGRTILGGASSLTQQGLRLKAAGGSSFTGS